MRRLRRLTFGDWLAAAGGASLLGSTFLPWFHQASSGGLTGRGDPHSPHANLDAWQGFGPLALLLIVAAIVPLGAAGRWLWWGGRSTAPLSATISAATGALTAVFVVVGSVLNVGVFGFRFQGPDSFVTITALRQGVLVAVLSAAAMTIGGLLTMWGLRPRGLQAQHRGVASEVEDELGQEAHQHGEPQ